MAPLNEDQDFLKLSPNDQARYLNDTDPDFKSLSSADQAAYLAHLTNQPLQEQPKEGVWNAAKKSFAQLNPFGEAKPQPVGDINQSSMMDYQARKSQRGIPYALGAGVAQAVGADVPGMEASAERGDPGGVIGHALPGVAVAAAPLALEGGMRAVGGISGTSTPARALQTMGRTAENFDLTKPISTFGKMGDYWRESSPEGRLLARTNQAVNEGRAARIPITAGAPPKVGATERIPVTPGWKTPWVGQQERIPVRPGATMHGAAMHGMAEGGMGGPDITFVPEPRTPFTGENEGYMASVPRDELNDLASKRKPGAGKQLQQLGKPIIYIPSGAEVPER
jgi:hypothetical protein